jgi:hypothetical protein
MTEELKCEMPRESEDGVEQCEAIVSQKVADFSKSKFNKIICYECQHGNPLCIEYIQDNQKRITPKDISKEYGENNWKEDIVDFETLLNEAHKKFDGKFSIKTELISHNSEKKSAVFKAIIEVKKYGQNQIYEAHGDANQDNCSSSMIKPHYLRLAETRGIARALRWTCNNAKEKEVN